MHGAGIDRSPSFPDLFDRNALVTGAGKPQGIGAELCRKLADQGCNLFFTYHDPAGDENSKRSEADFARQLGVELRARGVRSEFMGVDLAESKSAGVILETAWATLGPISILINNAAHSEVDGFQRLEARQLDDHYFVNVRASALLSVEFAKRYSAGVGGRIINMTSGQDLRPMPGELAYVASKGAISAFTRTLAVEVGHKGITVNAVDPGPTDTGWMPEDLKAKLIRESPFGRLGRPSDVAKLILFLASRESDWITGEVIQSRGLFL